MVVCVEHRLLEKERLGIVQAWNRVNDAMGGNEDIIHLN
jgi:hypothetical protein